MPETSIASPPMISSSAITQNVKYVTRIHPSVGRPRNGNKAQSAQSSIVRP
jgi:hypothetical protein